MKHYESYALIDGFHGMHRATEITNIMKQSPSDSHSATHEIPYLSYNLKVQMSPPPVLISSLMNLCEISSSHGGEYDVQSCLLGYTAV
jgi:hypothetical protein